MGKMLGSQCNFGNKDLVLLAQAGNSHLRMHFLIHLEHDHITIVKGPGRHIMSIFFSILVVVGGSRAVSSVPRNFIPGRDGTGFKSNPGIPGFSGTGLA